MEIPSPNMQALAKDGLTFDRAFVASPSCAPSRVALLTGRYGLRNGTTYKPSARRSRCPQMAFRIFRRWGYEVVAFGKVAHYAQVTTYGFDYAG